MFLHIFVNRFKCLIRDKQVVFWTFFYPIVLATLFSLAFSNITSADNFVSIPIAVVDNAEYRNETAFASVLESVSDTNANAEDKLFHVTVATKEQAEESLKNSKIKGYILFENGAHVVVKESGFGQSILKEFMDSYLQTGSAVRSVIAANPAAAANVMNITQKSYLADQAPNKENANSTMIYFYALIAMASLFGGFWGMREITDIQADLSPQGARVNLAPIHKMKALGYSMLASISIHFLSLLFLVAYLSLVLQVDFGGQIGYVILTCFMGSMVGISFGAMISAIVKSKEQVKTAVLICSSLALSFLSGLMVMEVKYTVTHAVPILAYINPANLISDALYSLYYYSSHARFFLNIGLLAGLSIVFYLVVYFVTRRQKYASL